MHPVRPCKIRRHLCKQLITGNPHVDCKTQFLPDTVPDPGGHIFRRAKQPAACAHIHKSLVNAVLLHHVRILPQNLHKRVGAFLIKTVIGRHQYQPRTLPASLHNSLSRLYPVAFRRNRLCQYNPAPSGNVPSHRRGNFP